MKFLERLILGKDILDDLKKMKENIDTLIDSRKFLFHAKSEITQRLDALEKQNDSESMIDVIAKLNGKKKRSEIIKDAVGKATDKSKKIDNSSTWSTSDAIKDVLNRSKTPLSARQILVKLKKYKLWNESMNLASLRSSLYYLARTKQITYDKEESVYYMSKRQETTD